LTTKSLHGVALRARIPRACLEHRQKEVGYKAAIPADGTALPITRGDLGTSRLKGCWGERYTSCRQCESGVRLPVAPDTNANPCSPESIALVIAERIGGQIANVAIRRKIVSQ
jgi:hypothetical protein